MTIAFLGYIYLDTALAPRFAGVPKKRSLFLGVVAWGKGIPQVRTGVPQGRRKDMIDAGTNSRWFLASSRFWGEPTPNP